MKVKEAKLSDLKGIEGKPNLLGGPSFSLSALEIFMTAPDFTIHMAGGSAMVLYHEGEGGKSRVLLVVGQLSPELLKAAEGAARWAGTVKITLEAEPQSEALPTLEGYGFTKKGDVANYFGKDRPAYFMEKNL
ncbi:MAG: hypothetical protein NT131_00125 [Methanomassiliicoccales archaeon]|nr:hypothetical protein [Methanomassiliicoccales archaeon]